MIGCNVNTSRWFTCLPAARCSSSWQDPLANVSPGCLSSADVALHGGREAGERAEGDAQHNEAVRNHRVLTGILLLCFSLYLIFFFFLKKKKWMTIFIEYFFHCSRWSVVTEKHVSSPQPTSGNNRGSAAAARRALPLAFPYSGFTCYYLNALCLFCLSLLVQR